MDVTLHVNEPCDFSVPLPIYNNIKPFPVPEYSYIHTQETVKSIVSSVDRFYKPRIPCRRCFNIYRPFVTKYYPNCTSNVKKQVSFLHKDEVTSRVIDNRRKYRFQKSLSMYDYSFRERDFHNHLNIIKICENFLNMERSFYNVLGEINDKKTISKSTFMLNLINLNSLRVKKWTNRSGKGFDRSYRKSYPLMSSRVSLVS